MLKYLLVLAILIPTVPDSSTEDKLQQTITVSFAKNTLDESIQMVSEAVGIHMEVVGADLQIEGITKNQSFGIDEVNQPAEKVLLTILAKANPQGKLIYVIRNRDGVESIEITTWEAAKKRGDTVPTNLQKDTLK